MHQELIRRAQGAAKTRQTQFVNDLAALVNIDSGSYDPAGVDRVGEWVSRRLTELGFSVERVSHPTGETGAAVLGRRAGSGTGTVLAFAHMDTVFDRGTATQRPFSRGEGALAHGPGVTDDKGGLVAGLHAAAILQEINAEHYGELILAFTPDEEIESMFGTEVLTGLASEADVAFCLEAARENGDLVIARKGAYEFTCEVHGRAAHSGVEPERGVHAGLEAAHLTVFLQEMMDLSRGLSVNVGVSRAGERVNIVPDRAELRCEMRSERADLLEEAWSKLEQRVANPVVSGARIALTDVQKTPPLEQTPASAKLGELALDIAAELGLRPQLAHTGGLSDANPVAAMGVPTLDGLGPIGGDDHTEREWIDLDSVPSRVALLATLLAVSGASAPFSEAT